MTTQPKLADPAPRAVLRSLQVSGSAPKKLKIRFMGKRKLVILESLGDLDEKFSRDVALATIGMTVQAFKRKLPGWTVSMSSDIAEEWYEKDMGRKSPGLSISGNHARDLRNHLARNLVEDEENVYRFAGLLERWETHEDFLDEYQKKVVVLDSAPVTPKDTRDKRKWTHYVPCSTYEETVRSLATATGRKRPPGDITTYGGKFYLFYP